MLSHHLLSVDLPAYLPQQTMLRRVKCSVLDSSTHCATCQSVGPCVQTALLQPNEPKEPSCRHEAMHVALRHLSLRAEVPAKCDGVVGAAWTGEGPVIVQVGVCARGADRLLALGVWRRAHAVLGVPVHHTRALAADLRPAAALELLAPGSTRALSAVGSL